jgi:hypothetical protein
MRLMGEIERARFLPFVRLGGGTPSSGEGTVSNSYSTLTGVLQKRSINWRTEQQRCTYLAFDKPLAEEPDFNFADLEGVGRLQ